MQTAVEWFIENINKNISLYNSDECYDKYLKLFYSIK